MTATEYVFAAAMTVLIVWIVAEVPVAAALKGPRSVRRLERILRSSERANKCGCGNTHHGP